MAVNGRAQLTSTELERLQKLMYHGLTDLFIHGKEEIRSDLATVVETQEFFWVDNHRLIHSLFQK
jgi:hypothetical protein